MNHLSSITYGVIFITEKYKTYQSEQNHRITLAKNIKIKNFSDIFLKYDEQK